MRGGPASGWHVKVASPPPPPPLFAPVSPPSLGSSPARHGPFVRRGRLGIGRQRPAAAALHRGGDAEAALPAARAPDDGALLGEMYGQAWPQVGQPSRGLLCELR